MPDLSPDEIRASVPLLDEHPGAAAALAGASLLYTDLDGTLFARGGSMLADAGGRPSTLVAEAIVALNAAGLGVVPVSGRDRSQLFELCRLLGWDSYIAEAGGVLVHGLGPDAVIRYNHGAWDPALLAGGMTPFRIIADGPAVRMLAEAFPGRSEAFSSADLERESSYILRGCLDRDAAQRALDTVEPPVDILDNGIVRTTDSLACFGTAHVYHIVPSGVSKRQAVALDLEWRGLAPGAAIAIGDAATDIQMAGSTSMMVLVDNAFESAAVLEDLAAGCPANVVRVSGARGEGWAQLARAWASARTPA